MIQVRHTGNAILPDWLKRETANDNEISRLAQQNLPILLPWGKQKVPLGTCYQSKLQSMGDPFLQKTPFVMSDLYMMTRTLQREVGTDSTFKSISTSRMVETGDHLSLGLGVGVGLPFLATVSVKGQFDQHVHENKDSNKTSIRATVKCGSVAFNRNPRLSKEGAIAIKYRGGYEAFCETYGDYFVAGYRLGGETGLLISSSSFRQEKIDAYAIIATAEVLFFSASKTWTKDFHEASAGRTFSLLGYDTLEAHNWNMNSRDAGVEAMQKQSETIVLRSQCILERGMQVLDDLKLQDGQDLTLEECDKLADSGLVTDLILLPMSSLREVAFWTLEDNII